MSDVLAGVLLLAGAGFALVAAVGVLRMPDLFMRMHAASKAGTLGAGLMLLAVAAAAADVTITARAVVAIVFLLLTAPVGAHLLARAAYLAGARLWPGTRIDELSGRYHPVSRHLASTEDTEDRGRGDAG